MAAAFGALVLQRKITTLETEKKVLEANLHENKLKFDEMKKFYTTNWENTGKQLGEALKQKQQLQDDYNILALQKDRLEAENATEKNVNNTLKTTQKKILDSVNLKTGELRVEKKLTKKLQKEVDEKTKMYKTTSTRLKAATIEIGKARTLITTLNSVNVTLKKEIATVATTGTKRKAVDDLSWTWRNGTEGDGPACDFFQDGQPQRGVWEGGGYVKCQRM